MAVTNVQLKQTISALVSGVGIRTQHSVGGNNIISDDVDIAFSVTFKCQDAANDIQLRYKNTNGAGENRATLGHTGSTNSIICDQEIGATGIANAAIIQDAAMAKVAVLARIIAIYLEAPVANEGVINVLGTPNDIGDVDFSALGGSLLLVPRYAPDVSTIHQFQFADADPGDILKVVVLGSTT